MDMMAETTSNEWNKDPNQPVEDEKERAATAPISTDVETTIPMG